jgi:hypothetical protein
MGDVFLGLVPDFHISRKSHEEDFKSNRHLLKDLMTPAFLYNVREDRDIFLWNIRLT